MKTNIIGKQIGWGVMTFLSLGIILYAAKYFSLNPDVFFPQQRDVYIAHEAALITHIIGGVLALGLGPFQFLTKLRTRWPKAHRWMGRLYLIGILLGSTAGLYMAFYAYTGFIASIGFAGLAVSWFGTGLMAYRTIRMGDTESHRKWIIRNFALTFAAVTLRLWLMPLTMSFGAIIGYEITAWLCWIPNLIIAEGMLQGWFRRSVARATV